MILSKEPKKNKSADKRINVSSNEKNFKKSKVTTNMNIKNKVQKRDNPSVLDHSDKKSLMGALLHRRQRSSLHTPCSSALPLDTLEIGSTGTSTSPNSSFRRSGAPSDMVMMLKGDEDTSDLSDDGSSETPVEWTLPLVDKETTEPQTMEEEFKRLQVLQSYFLLDTQG